MTEVSFHTGIADVPGYAYRLLRKALKKDSRLVLCAPAPLLETIDRALWVQEPLDFLPHARLPAGRAVLPRLAPTPIWLLEPAQLAGGASPVHEALVNLGPEPAPGFESFDRVIEIVGRDADAVRDGRLRWRHYAERGYRVVHHAIDA